MLYSPIDYHYTTDVQHSLKNEKTQLFMMLFYGYMVILIFVSIRGVFLLLLCYIVRGIAQLVSHLPLMLGTLF